ncbi:MAG: hypothetical protein WDO19_02410 [Bacteroidota bacterium]
MRKKIFIAVTAIILLVLLFIGFLEYRQYSSYKVPVHAGVQTILKINADAFIESFLKEYGFNFRKNINPPGKKETDSAASTGIYIPGNIFIYTLASKSSSTLFCTIPLSDVADFKLFLLKKLGISVAGDGQQNMGTGFNGQLTVLYSEEYAAFAYSPQKEEVVSVLQDLLNKKNLIPRSDELIKKLKEDRSHIVYAVKNGIATAEFTGKQILLHAGLTIPDGLSIPLQSRKRSIDGNSYASLFLNMKPAVSFFKKIYNIKQYSIETDSLLPCFNGYADLEVTGFTTQNDTITTYEYNDNFEKTGKRTIATVQAPAINMVLNAGPFFLTYLQKQQIVTPEQSINREVFPLYHVAVQQLGQILHFNTADQPVINQQFVNTPNFMELNIDFKKLQPSLDSSFLKKYITGITRLALYGKKGNNMEVSIQGSIDFDSSALKTAVEVIKSL